MEARGGEGVWHKQQKSNGKVNLEQKDGPEFTRNTHQFVTTYSSLKNQHSTHSTAIALSIMNLE